MRPQSTIRPENPQHTNKQQNPIPLEGYLRLSQIIGNKKADPPIPPIIPVSKSSFWLGVKSGRYPMPVKLGPKTTVWRAADIRALIENAGGEAL